jgi:hypothetical protein
VPGRLITPFAVATFACCIWAVPLAGADAATIKACVANGTGQIRVLKPGGKCTGTEKPLSWNSVGLQGPPGPQGPAGAQGPAGPQGPPGLSGFQTVTSQNVVPAGNIGTVDVACPAGETAIGGGYAVPFTATVLESHPSPASASVWRTSAAFPSTSGTLNIYVQCAQVPAAAARSTKVKRVVHTSRLSSAPRPAAGR